MELIAEYRSNGIDYAIVNTLLSTIKKSLESRGLSKGIVMRCYSVVAECLENAMRHGIGAQCSMVSFVAHFKDDSLAVSCSNTYRPDMEPRLKESLKLISELNANDLKVALTQRLMSKEMSPSGGAGVGLIIIKRKSDRFEYLCDSVPSGCCRFTLTAEIKLL